MTVSLVTLGQTQFGKVGDVSLEALNESAAETRSFSGTGYKRVNRFEIEDGSAPAPSAGSVSLIDYDGYVQWNSTRGAGNTLDLTGKDHDSLDFSWVRPSGYTAFPQAEVQQQLWCKKCATQTQVGCEADDYLAGSAFATTDGTTAGTGNVLDIDSWYVCSIVMDWDDEGVAGFPRQSDGYDAVASPAFGGFDDVDAIIVKTDTTTTTTTCLALGETCESCNGGGSQGDGNTCCSGWCDDSLLCVASDPGFC